MKARSLLVALVLLASGCTVTVTPAAPVPSAIVSPEILSPAPTIARPTPIPSSTPAPTAPPTPAPTVVRAGPTVAIAVEQDLGFTCDQCIKGNIADDGERIYHIPGCQGYDVTVIHVEDGERYFSNEAEAREAGWRKALNCP